MRERVRACLESALGPPDGSLRVLRWSLPRPRGPEGKNAGLPVDVVLGGRENDDGPALVMLFDYRAPRRDQIKELWIEREDQIPTLFDVIRGMVTTRTADGQARAGGPERDGHAPGKP